MPQRDIVHFLHLAESAHAPDLYIENAAGADLKCEIRVAGIQNRFIQANRRLECLLQPCMKIDLVVPQRLLDHEQMEGIEFAQVFNLIERVSGIRVHAENDIRPASSYLLQHIQIPSRLHFDLDSPISRRQLGFDLLQELFGRILNANRHSASNLAPRTTEQFPKRLLLLPGLRIPHRIFQRRLGHAMPANPSKTRCTITPAIEFTLHQKRRQIMLDRRPSRLSPLRTIKRIFRRHAFAPPVHPVGLNVNQQNAPAVDSSKARFEKMHERHVNFTKSNRFNFHNWSLIMRCQNGLKKRASMPPRAKHLIPPALVPPSQQKSSIPLPVALITQHAEPLVECPLEVIAISLLHRKRART